MATIDLDALRRLGILPMNPGDTESAIPDFPVINMGQEFGPNMEAELTQPRYFSQPRQAGVEDATSSTGGQPAAPVESGTLPWKQTTSQGIGMPELSQVLQLPIQGQPGGQQSIQAPEGTASWQRANPADTQSWLAAQTTRQIAERQAGMTAAENAATVEVGQQREVERQKAARQALQQRLMREVAMKNPAQATQLMQQQQTAGQLTAAQAAQGSPESQAFRQILTTQGLPAALAWIQQNHAQKQGPQTPEQRYQNTLAETLGRFGPGAQGARGATAETTTTARGGATRNMPLGERAPKWLHPETGLPAAATLTENKALQQGYVPVTTQGMTGAATAKAALIQMQEYEDLAPKLLTKQSGSTLFDILGVQGNRARLGALRLAGDPDAKRLEGMFGAIATLARATGDTANIAVAEREFLKNFTLTESDTLESAQAKINQAKRILRGVVESRGLPVGQPGGTPQGPPAKIEGTRIQNGEEQFFINGEWHRKKR